MTGGRCIAMLFGALAMVLPEGIDALARLERDDFVAALVRQVVHHYRSGLRAVQITPEIGLFAERNAGLNILFSLVIAGDVDDTMPPTRPVRVSISELARRFSVSRPHVLRLLRDAAAEGLVARSGTAQDAITILPPLSFLTSPSKKLTSEPLSARIRPPASFVTVSPPKSIAP